jgi:hypothetical protein
MQILKHQVLLQTSVSTAHMPHLSFAGDSIILSSAQKLGPAQARVGFAEGGNRYGVCRNHASVFRRLCVPGVQSCSSTAGRIQDLWLFRKTLEVNCYCGSLSLLGESCAWCSGLLLACIQVILKITKINENDVTCENASSHVCKLCCCKVRASSVPDGDRFPYRSSCVPRYNYSSWKWELSKLDSLRICRA